MLKGSTIKLGNQQHQQANKQTRPVATMNSAFGSTFGKVSANTETTDTAESTQQGTSAASSNIIKNMQSSATLPGFDTSKLWGSIQTGSKQKHTRTKQEEELIMRLTVPRKYARPVELLMKECLSSKYRKDWFGMLGLSKSADDAAIKKAFRDISLKVHPGKFEKQLPYI
jgi:DnaJ-class molecular chaperone